MSSRRRRSEHSSRYPTRWSEWEWNEQYQRHARYREVSKGNWEWQYDDPPPAPPPAQPQEQFGQHIEPTPWTPRDRSADPPGTLNTIEEQSQPNDDQRSEPDNYRIHSVSGITQGLAAANLGPYPENHHEREDDGKGKGVDTSYENQSYSSAYPAPQPDVAQDSLSDYQSSQLGATQGQPFQYSPTQVGTTNSYHPTPQSSYAGYEQQPSAQSDYNPTSGYAAPSSLYGAPSSSYRGPPNTQNNPGRRNIRTLNMKSKYDELDSRFKVSRSSDFKFGRVFKVLWSEPSGRGSTGTEITANSLYGENAFHKIRRFLVVKTRKGHSICIPILTYGYQGTLKHGVHPEDHAVVYSSRTDGPYFLEGEESLMTKKPIRIEVKDQSHKLDPTSRLNYAKIYTVEHNVKVLFIGQVAENYRHLVATAFNETHPPVLVNPPHSHADRPASPDFRHAEQDDPNYPVAAIPIATSSSSWNPSGQVSSSYPGTTYGYSAPGHQPYHHPLRFTSEAQIPPRPAEQSREDDYEQAPAGDFHDPSLYDP